MTTFRVWAPAVQAVAVATDSGDYELLPTGDDVFEADVPVQAGADYEFVLDGRERRPDPWSRSQPAGLRGRSRVVDPAALRRSAPGFSGVAIEELVDLRAARRHVLAGGHI